MSDVVVRLAEPRDVPGLVASSSALFAEDAGTRDPTVNATWPREQGERRFVEELADPLRLTVVAERDGEIVGHLSGQLTESWSKRPVRVATLATLHLSPDLRGGGFGAALTERFLEWAREQGAAVAEVSAYAANQGAVRFYERQGFAVHSVTLRADL
ncbi:GNAT family N-acetyltransferase [Actinomadura roseirufa]|uniref:GNAT family N-acetyltransferase n=1 Tax=Actinomadura roseirufa TaxID=2094049 RepID=UPI001041792E|nr:GNAT family N-acetyltransferase [Actinomadura roseirufa]